jgi:hypothetical protein
MLTKCRGRWVTCQPLCVLLFEKHFNLSPFWIVVDAEETEVDRDPARMFGNDDTGIQACRISRLSQSALRGSMLHSHMVKRSTKSKEWVPS